ncbi:hypothetical protein AC578_4595 [Pseudocercospora eumusae]|uniref:DUF6594 domain-containing protein n=1 Tax=Pseudocercospora eumusae TaxID=321146 RepID=A0A139H545_9PEZI|nr:hypothetical protein AC578_4595 [Pseudocercospora eumusae]KXS97532.1 hypothetical protein AC578_4595 [Pseudocercospora eumusae]KXS97533.1 hypothetical protein AC578_4595 [Pseudocercospora eumusae]
MERHVNDVDTEKLGIELRSPSTGIGSEPDVEAGKAVISPRQSWASRALKRIFREPKPKPAPEEDEWSSLTRKLDQTPKGYAAIAAFQSSDRNFLQYRGFGYLHGRVLSDLQYGIERLEEELDRLDQYDKEPCRRRLQCMEDDRDMAVEDTSMADYADDDRIGRQRPAVLLELREKLLEYDGFLLKTKEMATLQRPAKRDYESLKNFFINTAPVTVKEAMYVRRKEDIVTLRSGRESAAFDGLVEMGLNRMHKFMKRYLKSEIVQRLFLTQELRDKTESKYINYFSPAKIDALVNVIITMVIFILLVLPVIIMYRVTEMGKSQSPLDAIGVLIVFTLIFGMAVSALTTAKRHELFGASAAYAAVLVVFIGNFGVQQVDPGSTEAWKSILTQASRMSR